MDKKRVKVFAPATIANVGPGFDVLGVALDQPGDFVIAERSDKPGLHFSLHGQINDIPADTANVAAYVANLMLDEFKPPFGITLQLDKRMPIGSGLGSSGASSAAAAYAVNQLLPNPAAKMDIIHFAMEGERLASGSPHADNVAPSLLGGLCLIRSYKPLDVIQLPFLNQFHWVVIHPHLVINTRLAREILPASIPLSTAITQCGNLAALITGLEHGNISLIASALTDSIAEPARSGLIPGYDYIKQAALDHGAIGFSISGSGPSVFAVTTTPDIAADVSKAIQAAFLKYAYVECDSYCSRINMDGTKLVKESS